MSSLRRAQCRPSTGSGNVAPGIVEGFGNQRNVQHQKPCKKRLNMKIIQTAETLSKSGKRCSDLLENMSIGVAVYQAVDDGSDFVFREHNPAAEQITGLSHDTVIGRRVTEVFTGVAAIGLLEVFRRVYRTGEPETHPISEYHDERIILWVENSVFKLFSGEIVAVYRDITDRKHLEDALLKANTIMNHSPLVAFRWKNEEGWPVQFVPENVDTLFGYSAREFMEGKISFKQTIFYEQNSVENG